jgi:hypothetical protein
MRVAGKLMATHAAISKNLFVMTAPSNCREETLPILRVAIAGEV